MPALLPLLLVLALTAPEGGAADTVRYRIRIGEMTIGRSVSTTTRGPDGTTRRREQSEISVTRGEQEIGITEEVVWTEAPASGLISVSVERRGMGPDVWRDLLVRTGRGWRRERVRSGRAEADTLRGGPLQGPVAMEQTLAACLDSTRARSVDTETMRPATYRVTSLRADTLHGGEVRIPCRVFSISDSALAAAGETPLLQWRDERGSVWREVDRDFDSTVERDEIAEAGESAGRFDALSWRPLPVEGDPPPASPCEFLLIPTGDSPYETANASRPPVPNEEGQRLSPGDIPGSWRIRLDRDRPAATTEADRERWKADPELAAALESDLIVDSAEPGVREFARSAVAGARTPTEEALRLEKAVNRRITTRDLGTVFATASQTLRAGRGDCTEHAVLLAACCRSRGIPARLVAGIVPAGDRMLFHLWIEAFLDRWCPLDATLGRGSAAPCAIALLRWEKMEEGTALFAQPFDRLAGRYRFQVEVGSR
jgi:hypothetical protein